MNAKIEGNNPVWERILVVLDHSGIRSINALAREIGLGRAESLYRIKKGVNGISKELAKRISSIYPKFSEAWLLCGDQLEVASSEIVRIPYYEIFTSKSLAKKPDKEFVFSENMCSSVEVMTLCKTSALEPRVQNGSHVFMKQSSDLLIYGNIYYIETSNMNLIRVVTESKDKNHVDLVSYQPEMFSRVTIARSEIKMMYLVCGIFSCLLE